MRFARVFVCALLMVAGAGAAFAEAEADDCGARALAKFRAHFAGVEDLAARFEQISVSAGFPDAQHARGVVEVARPAQMRWQYETPEPSLVVTDGRTLWLVDSLAKEVSVTPLGADGRLRLITRLLLGDDDGALQRDFVVRARVCTSARARLRLTPRDAAHVEYLELLIELESGALLEVMSADLLGGQTRVLLTDVRTNLAPPRARFRYKPAPDERVIQLAPPTPEPSRTPTP